MSLRCPKKAFFVTSPRIPFQPPRYPSSLRRAWPLSPHTIGAHTSLRQQLFRVPRVRFLSTEGIERARTGDDGLPLWGFARKGEALERHKRQPVVQNPNMTVWITGNSIDLLRLNREELEAGAQMVYEHLASTWEKASVEAWRRESSNTVCKALCDEFSSQAADMSERGLTPKIRSSDVEARIVYVLWLPDALSVNFHPNNYTRSFLGRVMQRIDWRISVTSAFMTFMRKLVMGGDTSVTVHMLAHVHGTEHVSFVDRQGKEVCGEEGDFDHLISFEAKVQWKDVMVPVTVEAAGPAGDPADVGGSPPLHWEVKDMNNHLLKHGRRVQFSIKLPGDE